MAKSLCLPAFCYTRFYNYCSSQQSGGSMKYNNKDLVRIIKIQEKIIKANAASARSYKKELKMLGKLYRKAFNAWVDEMSVAAGLRKDCEEI